MKGQRSQNAMILDHLLSGGTITPLEAQEYFKCMRLASRVSDLKAKGHNIVKRMIYDNGTKYAEYRLVPGQQKLIEV